MALMLISRGDADTTLALRRLALMFYERVLARKELTVSAADFLISSDVFLCF